MKSCRHLLESASHNCSIFCNIVIIFSAGCALTYITLNKELWMVAATYGFVSAFGQNIALIPTLTTAMKWFPNSKGTVMGIVVGGFGGGAFVFNQIQTALVNSDNQKVRLSLDSVFFAAT